MPDRTAYTERKRLYSGMLPVYGRNTVKEALHHPRVTIYRLHLADSNRPSPQLQEIIDLATRKGAEVLTHSRAELSRISRNGRQDQGVAADLRLAGYGHAGEFLDHLPAAFRLIALDRVTNPQNLGMVIRSVAAAPATGLLLSHRGGAPIGPLTIKASAGAVFHAQILVCDDLTDTLTRFQSAGTRIVGLRGDGDVSVGEYRSAPREIFLLGNESSGLSPQLTAKCDVALSIPMSHGVESLNVSVAAALISFLPLLRGEHVRPEPTR